MKLIRKYESETVSWSEECGRAFCELKELLLSYPVLRNVNFSLPFTYLYFSRKLLPSEHVPREQKFSVIEKECFAIKLGVGTFAVYLIGRQFNIQMDHRALQWLSKSQNLNSRLTRWSIALQPFKFKVIHRGGSENANTDALSRIPVSDKDKEGGV